MYHVNSVGVNAVHRFASHLFLSLFLGGVGVGVGLSGGLLACLIILIAVAYRVELHERGVGPHSDTATDHIHTVTLLQITPTH